MNTSLSQERLQQGFRLICSQLLTERDAQRHWTGELSTSALSTATAVMALHQVCKGQPQRSSELSPLIEGGLDWLVRHQNPDGGWGDTVKSFSNISTTMLTHASFRAVGAEDSYTQVIERAAEYIERAGGVSAVIARYGKDKTFSVPILTHCALSGLVDWRQVSALPFELACLPHRFYATIRLPVVSYALPALIAIGQVRHHFRRSWNPLLNWLRDFSISRSLRILRRIQPETGGFLEATPLTSFVTMSLAAKGLSDHPVVEQGVAFIKHSVLADGSWPIDTNLATWVTTLSVNALGEALPAEERESVLVWLLGQQYRVVHPFTHADPGGWAWTDLSGGVPDADDTPGAMLAIARLAENADQKAQVRDALQRATQWLLDLQNRDGGWPTFCRGWGTLPFDRSSPDITAHSIRGLTEARAWGCSPAEIDAAITAGFRFLDKVQQADGSWLPLWFGNQHAPDDINPVYGTSKVLLAYQATERVEALPLQLGLRWLRQSQNADGGWGGCQGTPSSVEETALAVDTLLRCGESGQEARRGLVWLLERIEAGTISETAPIGFYFAKLWYFERLYPLIFAASALRSGINTCLEAGHSKD